MGCGGLVVFPVVNWVHLQAHVRMAQSVVRTSKWTIATDPPVSGSGISLASDDSHCHLSVRGRALKANVWA